jgi:hypothetical protein
MDAQQLPIAAGMLPQRPIVSPVAQPALTRDSFNAQSFGRATNRLVKEVCVISSCARLYKWSGDFELVALLFASELRLHARH